MIEDLKTLGFVTLIALITFGGALTYQNLGGEEVVGFAKYLPIQLNSTDTAGDEECLTYESTGTKFEWQPCGAGGGSSLHVDATGSVYPADGDFHSAPYYTATSTATASTFPFASTTALTATNLYGALTGNADTATALAGNGANCGAGEIPLGVDTAGAVEGCYEPTEGDITDLAHRLGGTNLTLVTNTLNVDDAFLINDGDDTTTGVLTATGFISGTKNLTNYADYFNGSFIESFDATSTSNGSVISLVVADSASYTGGLTMRFSTGDVTLSTATSVALTAGTDASPTENFVFIPIDTQVLTVSTSDWDTSQEHIKVSYLLCPSATFVQTNGDCYVNQNWNDHSQDSNSQGHQSHVGEKIRRFPATYFSGVDSNGADGYLTPTASNVEFKSTSGIIYQMHKHTFPAVDTSGGDLVLVKNWSGDAYHDITNLFDITNDSTGSAIGNNKYFNLTVWGVANKTGQYEPLMINLPSCSYNSQTNAENDSNSCDDLAIPTEFKGESSTGFLIARMTIKMGTTWDMISSVDLRGLNPQNATGGTAGTPQVNFADNVFTVFDDSDVTKILAFQVSGVDTATTRTLTVPNANGTIMLTSDEHAEVTLAGTPNYLTLSTQAITLTKLDISDDTNATAGVGLTLTANDFACDTASGSVFGCTTSADWTIFNNKISSTSIDTFSELDTFISDKALVNKADGAVWLGVHDFGGATSVEIPNGASPTVDATGEIAVDTTSGQLKWYDGSTTHILTGTTTPAFNLASTTLDASGQSFNTASSTFLLKNSPEPFTLIGVYCVASTTGNADIQFVDGSGNKTEGAVCDSGTVTYFSTNNTWTAFEDFNVTASGTTNVNRITATAIIKKTAD